MYMKEKNLGAGRWHEYDFRIAGNSEFYKALLRQMVGLPAKLPGENGENQQSLGVNKRQSHKISDRRNMSGFFHQGKR